MKSSFLILYKIRNVVINWESLINLSSLKAIVVIKPWLFFSNESNKKYGESN